MKVRELLSMIPNEILQKIGEDSGVDKNYQLLTGAKMFKLLLFSLSETTRISLRSVERVYESALFQEMTSEEKQKRTRHSSISDRLGKIKPTYFEHIFKHLVGQYDQRFSDKTRDRIKRFDSTIISLSAHLFGAGLNYGGMDSRHFKITVGQKGLIPFIVKFATTQAEGSEEIALRNAIRSAVIDQGDIVLFDRGIRSGKTFNEFTESNIVFITRSTPGRKIKTIEALPLVENTKTETLEILSDEKVLLWDSNREKFCGAQLRMIKTKSLKNQEELWFLTNSFLLSAADVTNTYLRRWDIEVFFRFVKQELNLKHFLVRNFNGLMVYVYMILILSVLLLVYKITNKLQGFKFVKWDFFQELEAEIIAEIITFCGGDSSIFLHKHGFA